MIHTKITPNDVLVNVSFYVPQSYIGKELDIIAFTQGEGIQNNFSDEPVEELKLSKSDKAELTNRVEHYLENPNQLTTWDEVKENIRKQL